MTQTGLDLTMAVVQTAYANGSSTHYLQDTMKVRKHLFHFFFFYVGTYGFSCILGNSAMYQNWGETPTSCSPRV